jgi:hypothetical protein
MFKNTKSMTIHRSVSKFGEDFYMLNALKSLREIEVHLWRREFVNYFPYLNSHRENFVLFELDSKIEMKKQICLRFILKNCKEIPFLIRVFPVRPFPASKKWSILVFTLTNN